MLRLRDALHDYDRIWVTQPSERATELIAQGERVVFLPEYSRNPMTGRLPAALWRSLETTLRHRPRLVLTTGSGLVVPFCALARLGGAKLIFVETAARVRTPSYAGVALSRLANRTIVQWEPMLDVYPNARLARPSILDRVRPGTPSDGTGTFVGVGTHIYAFDRLLRMVDSAVEQGMLPRPVTAQTGVSSYEPRTFERQPWLSPLEIDSAVAGSRYVVTHGGTGLMSAALTYSRRPLVLARRGPLREHFDDHQKQLVGELDRLSLVVELGDEITEDDLRAVDAPIQPTEELTDVASLGDVVREEVRAKTADRGAFG